MSHDPGPDDEESTPGGTADESAGADRSADLETKAERLEQREEGLDRRAQELKERAASLDEREQALDDREQTLDERESDVAERANRISSREQELDDRETAIREREQKLDDRAAELDRKEQTLHEYVDESVSGFSESDLAQIQETVATTVEEAVSTAVEGLPDADDRTQLGTIGNLLLGLVGITLIVAGVANGFATEIESIPTLFGNPAGNFGASAVLIFSGLAANLAAAAGRV